MHSIVRPHLIRMQQVAVVVLKVLSHRILHGTVWYVATVAAFTLEFSICIALHCGDVRRPYCAAPCGSVTHRAVPCLIRCERTLTVIGCHVCADSEDSFGGGESERLRQGNGQRQRYRWTVYVVSR